MGMEKGVHKELRDLQSSKILFVRYKKENQMNTPRSTHGEKTNVDSI
jgi:hypothetical protein